MIDLPVSEAYAFDFLSILRVKHLKGMKDETYKTQVMEAIIDALGEDVYERVLNSPEMSELHEANFDVFDAIERAHQDMIKASEVQKINRRRFDAKQALQNRFWPDNSLCESKT